MPFHDDDADAQAHINACAAVLSQCDDELDDDDTNDENKSKVACGGEGKLNASEKGLAGGPMMTPFSTKMLLPQKPLMMTSPLKTSLHRLGVRVI